MSDTDDEERKREFVQLCQAMTPEQQADFSNFLRRLANGMPFAEACEVLPPSWDPIIAQVTEQQPHA